MPHVTAILGNEVGIQYQGVKDSSSLTASYPIVGVMIGQFRRGRLDKPMTITRQNIKAKLGFDPTNPDYIAVQDALDSGVPSVQVLRVLGGNDCMPTELHLLEVDSDIMSSTYYLTYDLSIPELGIDVKDQHVSYLKNLDDESNHKSIFQSLLSRISGDFSFSGGRLIVSSGGGGICYFSYGSNYNNGLAISGSMGSVKKGIANLTLKRTPNDIDGTDILSLMRSSDSDLTLFNQAPIKLHSCGLGKLDGY